MTESAVHRCHSAETTKSFGRMNAYWKAAVRPCPLVGRTWDTIYQIRSGIDIILIWSVLLGILKMDVHFITMIAWVSCWIIFFGVMIETQRILRSLGCGVIWDSFRCDLLNTEENNTLINVFSNIITLVPKTNKQEVVSFALCLAVFSLSKKLMFTSLFTVKVHPWPLVPSIGLEMLSPSKFISILSENFVF